MRARSNRALTTLEFASNGKSPFALRAYPMTSWSNVKGIVCDVNGTMFSLQPLGERMQQVGLQKSDLQVSRSCESCHSWSCVHVANAEASRSCSPQMVLNMHAYVIIM